MDISPLYEIWQIWVVLGLILVAIGFYARESLPIEMTSFIILTALLLLFHFAPLEQGQPSLNTLLAGFANPALLTVMALLVVGQAMFQAEAFEGFTTKLSQVNEKFIPLVITSLLIFALAASAWLNNTPVIVMLIPLLAGLASRTNASLNKMMMPLSFVCILGGMTTLIGSSANILTANVAERLGAAPFGFFDITLPALMLVIPGLLYIIFVMPYLLPKSDPSINTDGLDSERRDYIVKIDIHKDSPLMNMTVDKNNAFVRDEKSPIHNMRILRIQHGEQSFYPKKEEITIQEGDSVILSATREVLAQAIKSRNDIFGLQQVEDRTLADAVIAPASRIIGRSLKQLTLQYETGCHVLGILHRTRMAPSFIQNVRFEAGDVILVVGSKRDLQSLTNSHDVFLLNWLSTSLPHRQQTMKATLILLAMIGLIVFEVMPIVLTALLAATAMILTNVINLRQALRAIDQRIYFLIATALALAAALEATQAPVYFAHALLGAFDQQPFLILLSMFLLIATMTNLLSNNAAAVLFAPLMIQITTLMNLPAELAIVTVILAANCSFATPIAYQTNLLVMAPGRYQFFDFVKAGTPLILLLTVCYGIMIKVLYNV